MIKKNLVVIILVVTLFQTTTQSFVSLKKLYQDYVEKQQEQENLKTKNYQPEQIHISYGCKNFKILSCKNRPFV